jgi:hypothetical protein
VALPGAAGGMNFHGGINITVNAAQPGFEQVAADKILGAIKRAVGEDYRMSFA